MFEHIIYSELDNVVHIHVRGYWDCVIVDEDSEDATVVINQFFNKEELGDLIIKLTNAREKMHD